MYNVSFNLYNTMIIGRYYSVSKEKMESLTITSNQLQRWDKDAQKSCDFIFALPITHGAICDTA